MKFLKYLFYTAFVGVMLVSCSKQIELAPTDTFTDINAFRTINDAQLGTNEAYARYGAYLNTIYTVSLITDEAKLGFDNSGQGAITYRYQSSSDAGDLNAAYGSYYFLIDQVNRVLDKLPNVIATTTEEPRRNYIKAQLLALRGISHFGLLQSFCKNYNASEVKGVPIVLKSDILTQPKRNTMGEVMTQIEKDLSDASALLPAVTVSSFSDTTLNQVNIAAYRARIALYKGDYTAAINYATTVISSVVKPLATSANFPGIWTDANNMETLFRTRLANSTALGGLFTTTGNLIYIAPSDKLVASYAASDIRKSTFIGGVATKYYLNKYFTSSRGGRIVDMKNCRISEMYLIRAEAYAKNTIPDLVSGTADLNTLRTQRISGYVNQIFATTADLITAILDERYKELCFEGFRLFDLKRNGLSVQRNLSDVTSTAWQTLATGDYKFILPIPQLEILANPNMVQNDGY
ncbi:MAG: RagB/SusD family nutrient uptake outer membrane protein [Deinococcales bacterium]|nr:RagB/SusD family nutrient uptake outer membrane protein [Chitinophagaceae bacterium]